MGFILYVLIDIYLICISMMLLLNSIALLEVIVYFLVIMGLIYYLLENIVYIGLIYLLIFFSGLFLLYLMSIMVGSTEVFYIDLVNSYFWLFLVVILMIINRDSSLIWALMRENFLNVYNMMFFINNLLYSTSIRYIVGIIIIVSMFCLKLIFK